MAFRTLWQAPANWLGTMLRAKDPDQPRHVRDTEEKVKTGPAGAKIPWFLPYFDPNQQVGETLAMRLAYRKMVGDPNVKASILGKVLAVAALDTQFHPAKKKDARAKLHADYCDWQFTKRISGGMPGIAWNVLVHALLDGYSVNERVWGIEIAGQWEGKHVLKKLKPKDTNNDVIPLVDEYRNITGIRGVRYNASEVYDVADFVIYTHLGLYDNPGGMSDLRAAYQAYWFLDTVRKLRAMGAEKRALPVIAGSYKEASKQSALEKQLAKVKSANWLAIPEDVKLQVLDISGRADDYFTSFCKDLREEIVLGITGAILSTLQGGQGVQRGSSAVHKDTADVLKWHLSAALAHVFNDRESGLCKDVIDRNFYGSDDYPTISFGGIDDAELAESIKVDQALSAIGWKLSIEDMEERYGRRFATDAADTLIPPANPVPGVAATPQAEVTRNGHASVTQPAAGVPARPFRFAEGWDRYIGEAGDR